MSEYTPPISEVRTHWGIAVDQHRRAERLAEFDRMIAEVERAAAEKAYERGRLDERHDCERYGEYERGEITGPQLRDSLRQLYPYRRDEGGTR